MGLLDKLLGNDSDDDQDRNGEERENVPVTQFFFVGNEIETDPLNESMLVLRQGPPERGDISAENWKWSVVKCNEPLKAGSDMDLQLCVYREGAVVDAGEAYQSHLAWLLSSEEIQDLTNDELITRSFAFPEELRDEDLPEGTHWGKEDLQSLLLPFQV